MNLKNIIRHVEFLKYFIAVSVVLTATAQHNPAFAMSRTMAADAKVMIKNAETKMLQTPHAITTDHNLDQLMNYMKKDC